MPIIRCPQCRRRFDPGSGVDEALEHRPDNTSLKVACPACGQWVRLPEREPCPAPNAPAEMLKEMRAQSRLIDDDRLSRKSASRSRRGADDDYEDDDDDWEDRPRRSRSRERSKPRKNNSVLIVLGILGGVFLVVLMSCGGLFYLSYAKVKQVQQQQKAMAEANLAKAKMQANDPPNRIKNNMDEQIAENRRQVDEIQQNISANIDSQRMAMDFIRLLRDQNTKEAYQLFTDKLKQKFTNVAAFDDFLAKHPTRWIVAVPVPVDMDAKDPTRRVFTITNLDRGRITKFIITVVNVDTQWRVDELTSDSD